MLCLRLPAPSEFYAHKWSSSSCVHGAISQSTVFCCRSSIDADSSCQKRAMIAHPATPQDAWVQGSSVQVTGRHGPFLGVPAALLSSSPLSTRPEIRGRAALPGPESGRLLSVRCVRVSSRKHNAFKQFNGQAGPSRGMRSECVEIGRPESWR